MASTADLFRRLLGQADRHGIEALYAAISVDPDEVRAALARRHLAWLDRDAGHVARIEDLDHAADRVIADAAGSVGVLGGVAGLGGFTTLPPEASAWLATVVRLSQRLAVVYGFDPRSDRGRLAVTRALAGAFGVDLPVSGISGLRISDLVGMSGPDDMSQEVRRAGAMVVRAMLMRTLRLMTGRLGRLIPVVSSGVSAFDNARQLRELGAAMKDVYGRLVELPARLAVIEDVEIVR